jgi:hypothetical protein
LLPESLLDAANTESVIEGLDDAPRSALLASILQDSSALVQ